MSQDFIDRPALGTATPAGRATERSLCAVTRQLPGAALERLASRHDVRVWPGVLPPDRAGMLSLLHEAEGLICLLTDPIDAQLLAECPHLRAIANYAVGYDNIDLAAAEKRGIQVSNTPDILTDATADHTFALLGAAARLVVEADAYVRAGRWRTWETQLFLGKEIRGARLGLIGTGRIGRAVASRAAGYGMSVHTYHHSQLPGEHDELLATCDYVSLHCPLTPSTFHLIDQRALQLMHPDAILINTSRGGLVDLSALAVALHEGRLGGAALDTTDPEPIGLDHPIMSAPHVIVSPHIGSATISTRVAMADLAVDNLLCALAGEPMLTPVTQCSQSPREQTGNR